jgi:hypothetical protein
MPGVVSGRGLKSAGMGLGLAGVGGGDVEGIEQPWPA